MGRRHAVWVTCRSRHVLQAPLIKEKYELCHLATGDLLRAAVEAGMLTASQACRGRVLAGLGER